MKKNDQIKFNVFGKIMIVERKNDEWVLFLDSGAGFKSQVTDVVIPCDIEEMELDRFLDDMYHEMASAECPAVTRIK